MIRRIAETPEIDALTHVEPVPFDLRLAEFNHPNEELTTDGARAILTEIWRLTRNPRLLEIEQETRGQMVPDLQLSTIAAEHTQDGVLDPTAAARDFIRTVRTDYPGQLTDGPHSQWANMAAPAELDMLNIA